MPRIHRTRPKLKIPPAPGSKSIIEKIFFGNIWIVGVAAGFSMPLLTAFETKHPTGLGVQILLSTLIFGGAWFAGIIFTSSITESEDKKLFGYFPLTPLVYYLGNARRLKGVLISAMVVSPVVATVFLVIIAGADWQISVSTLLLLCGLQTLTYWLAFVVPLFEALTNKRWTAAYFFPRLLIFPAVRWPRASATTFAAMVAVCVAISQNPTAVELIVARVTAWYSRLAPAGEVVLFLASPFAGCLQLYQVAQTYVSQLLWIVLFLVLFLTFLLWRIWQVAKRPIEQIDSEIYQQWVEHHKEFEQAQHTNAWFQQLRAESQLPKNIVVDEDDYFGLHKPTADEEGSNKKDQEITEVPAAESLFLTARQSDESRTLSYDQTLSPEVQAVRHSRFWLPLKQRPLRVQAQLLALGILVAWGIGTLSRASFSKSQNFDILWQLLVVLAMWGMAIVSNTELAHRISWLNIRFCLYPQNFNKLRHAEVTWTDVVRWVLFDLLVATAAVLAIGLPWSNWPVTYAFMLLVRTESYFCPTTFANLQLPSSAPEQSLSTNPAWLSTLLPMWLGLYVVFFHPALDLPGRVLQAPMGLRIHENFLPAMFDLRTGQIVLPLVAIGIFVLWLCTRWHRRKYGNQSVTLPHYIPTALQAESKG